MSTLCVVLLSVACLFNSLAIVIHVWSVRLFRPRFSVKDLKRANDLQSFVESVDSRYNIVDEVSRIYSRPCAEDESVE